MDSHFASLKSLQFWDMFICLSGALFWLKGVGEEVLHLHLYTDFRISTNPLNWHTEWCMFVSICVCLVMAFVISKRERGRQKLDIYWSSWWPSACIVWSENTDVHCISVCWAKLIICFISMETSSVWTSSPQILFRALRNGQSKCSCIDTVEDPSQWVTIKSAHGTHNF